MVKQESKWFVVMGDSRITDFHETETDCFKELQDKSWFIMLRMSAIVAEKLLEEKLQIAQQQMKEILQQKANDEKIRSIVNTEGL